MDRFMAVVLPIFIFAALAAFIYHRTKAKKDGKTAAQRSADVAAYFKSWGSKRQEK